MSNQEFWQSKIKIGNDEFSRFMSAPLDGITDSPFRRLIRDFSLRDKSPTELLFTEMRHVAMIANERTGIALRYDPIEQPLAFQVSTNKTEFIDKAIEKILAAGFKSINLNCGCPAKAVIKSKCGSALMEDVAHLEMLLKYFIKVINGHASFTIKIRAGFKKKNALDVAKMAQDCGVDAIIIHPRTQPEGFVSRLDYELTRQVKQAISVPLIFSGNISRFEMAQKVYEMTGCDGYMIGRALWGAPWKMREMTDASEGKTFEVTVDLALKYALKHLDNNIQFYGPKGFVKFKKQLPQYVRFVEDAAEWRKKLLRSQTELEMRDLFAQLINESGVKLK